MIKELSFNSIKVRGPQLQNMVPYTTLAYKEPKVGPDRDMQKHYSCVVDVSSQGASVVMVLV